MRSKAAEIADISYTTLNHAYRFKQVHSISSRISILRQALHTIEATELTLQAMQTQ